MNLLQPRLPLTSEGKRFRAMVNMAAPGPERTDGIYFDPVRERADAPVADWQVASERGARCLAMAAGGDPLTPAALVQDWTRRQRDTIDELADVQLRDPDVVPPWAEALCVFFSSQLSGPRPGIPSAKSREDSLRRAATALLPGGFGDLGRVSESAAVQTADQLVWSLGGVCVSVLDALPDSVSGRTTWINDELSDTSRAGWLSRLESFPSLEISCAQWRRGAQELIDRLRIGLPLLRREYLDEKRMTASYGELGEEAVHPGAVTLFSDAQYAGREEWKADCVGFQTVDDPLDENLPIEWSPVWSLTEKRHKYLPAGYLYFHCPQMPGAQSAWDDSNGNAAGSSLHQDNMWYNQLRLPVADLESFEALWFEEFRRTCAGLDREVWVLDLTADFGIPAIAACSRSIDKPAEDILMTFGLHFDARLAVLRAPSEMNQWLSVVVHAVGNGYAYPDPVQIHWWRAAGFADHPYLRPDRALSATTRDTTLTCQVRIH